MEKRKIFPGMALVAALILLMSACGSSAQQAPAAEFLVFDIGQISALQAPRSDTGSADGAFYFTGAKTTLESGTYEIQIDKQGRPLNVKPYGYMEFEIMTDNLELFDEIGGFYPRLMTGEDYVQFNCSGPLKSALAGVAEPEEWVKVTVPIGDGNTHENGSNFKMVVPRVDGLRFRFICADMEDIEGKIYLRNIQFVL